MSIPRCEIGLVDSDGEVSFCGKPARRRLVRPGPGCYGREDLEVCEDCDSRLGLDGEELES